MPTAYIETTIPSYYVARASMNVIQASRQASTRAWWDGGQSSFDLFTSQEVLQEARLGDADMARQRLEILSPLPKLELTEEVGALAQKLIQAGLVPEKAASDAVHIAVASVHQMKLYCDMELQAYRQSLHERSTSCGGSRCWLPFAGHVQSRRTNPIR